MLRRRWLGDTVVRSSASPQSIRGQSVLAAALIALLCGLIAPLSASAQDGWAPPSKVWVEETGHTVDKTFMRVWRANLSHLGNPISQEVRARVKLDEVKTKERTLQYFQNGALVSTGDDPREGDSWHVRALPLGVEALKLDAKRLKGIKLAKAGDCDKLKDDVCQYFKATKHTVRHGFLAYWETYQGEQLIGAPITEEFVAKDGWTTQYFENGVLLWKMDKGVVARGLGTEAAAREKVKTAKVNQPEDVPAYAEALFTAPVAVVDTRPSSPGPIQGGYKEIVISISQQYMWAYEGGATITETYVSTGTAETPEVTTPVGNWTIHTKIDMQDMEGTLNGEYYFVADVPWVMYFDFQGNALHGAYWHNNFGSQMSHGCVNLPMDIASFLYGWAEIGTSVTVIG